MARWQWLSVREIISIYSLTPHHICCYQCIRKWINHGATVIHACIYISYYQFFVMNVSISTGLSQHIPSYLKPAYKKLNT